VRPSHKRKATECPSDKQKSITFINQVNSNPKDQSNSIKAEPSFISINKVPKYHSYSGLFTPTLLTAHLTVPMFYLAYLIKNNPCKIFINKSGYLSFPAALPIMGFV
jgi:hypothetical protein